MRIFFSIVACVAGFGFVVSTVHAASSPSSKRPHPTLHAQRRPAGVPSATTCTTDNSSSFVGVNDGNVAGDAQTAVLGGASNEACDFESAIAGGEFNGIGNNGNAYWNFIGAGTYNVDVSQNGFIGAGTYNVSGSFYSGVGAGAANAANGSGSFIGGGGSNYYDRNSSGDGPPPADGNTISGDDAFIGAGDLNVISGNGSFIGAGGYTLANGGAKSGGNSVFGTDSFIGAGNENSVYANGAFVGAGLNNHMYSTATYGVIVGGTTNLDQAANGVILGGDSNSIFPTSNDTAVDAFVGGGHQNAVSAQYGAIAGGNANQVTGQYGNVAGGSGNIASGNAATVPGGYHNLASGQFSFAAGFGAYADTDGSFVWSDDSKAPKHLASTKPDEFLARATGGVEFYTNTADTTGARLAPGSGTWGSASDRTLKRDVAAIDDSSILDKVAALPVSEWSYTSERGVRHLGPMAQDFYATFRIGEDDRHITAIDEDGVALAAIKALRTKDVTLEREVAELREQVRALVAASKTR